MKSGKIKIAFVGGGTLGPVVPLLAVMKKVKELRPDAEFIWFGTPKGPERSLIPQEITFYDIPVAKFPRYPNLHWFTFPFRYMYGQYKARKILHKERPNIIVGAGGFTQVPVILAAYDRDIPVVIHQLDKEPGLSNQTSAMKTVSVTTSFAYEKEPFSEPVRSYQIKTPVRFSKHDLVSKEKAAPHFGLDPDRPVTLIMGGGTGALHVNKAIAGMLDDLLKETQVIHSTGKGKKVTRARQGYVVTEFLDEDLVQAYSAADLVVSRAGMGAISECSALEKPMVLVPIPNSHQEQNAEAMREGGGAVVVKQDLIQSELVKRLRELLPDKEKQTALVTHAQRVLPTDDGKALAEVVLEHIR